MGAVAVSSEVLSYLTLYLSRWVVLAHVVRRLGEEKEEECDERRISGID